MESDLVAHTLKGFVHFLILNLDKTKSESGNYTGDIINNGLQPSIITQTW